MSAVCLFGISFAQVSRLEQIGRGMRMSQSRFELIDFLPLALAAVAFIAVLTAVDAWRRRRDFRERCDDPQKLFRELCKIHKLEPSQRRLLQSLVKIIGYEQPAQVFLSPAVFRQQLPASLKGKAEQYQSLADRLFAR